jgi:UDP-glucuronate 4-epimerase
MKRILITGVAGFLGSNVAKMLLEQGYTILGTDVYSLNDLFGNLYPTSIHQCTIRWRMSQLFQHTKFKYTESVKYECSIMDFRPNIILHFASSTLYPNNSLVHISNAMDLEILSKTIDMAYDCGVDKIFYSSSAAVYEPGSVENHKQHTSMRLNSPNTNYGIAKTLCEKYVESINVPFDIIGLRIFSAYGPLSHQQMVPWVFGKAVYEQSSVDIMGNSTRDFIHVDDVSHIIFQLLAHNDLPPIINVGTGTSVSLSRLMDIMDPTNLVKRNIINVVGTHTKADTHELESIIGPLDYLQIEHEIPKVMHYQRNFLDYIKDI